jgi:transposase
MIVPFMPERRRFGPRCSPKLRAVVEAMFYIASTGCQWRQLPKDFPPYSTVQGYFYAWVLDGRWELTNHALVMASREKVGRHSRNWRQSGSALDHISAGDRFVRHVLLARHRKAHTPLAQEVLLRGKAEIGRGRARSPPS